MTGVNITPSAAHQVVVVVGQADARLTAGLRLVGLHAIAHDGQVTIWGRPPIPLPTTPIRWIRPGDPDRSRLFMTIADAALALGLDRSTVYQLIGRGRLEIVRIGTVTRVPIEAIDELVERGEIDELVAGLVAL